MPDKKVIDSWSILEFLKWKERVDEVEDEETYLVRVAVGHRIAIFEPVREFLGIEEGDLLRVTVQIEEKRQKPVEDLPPDETEPEIIVEEPIEKPVEEPTVEPVDETEVENEPEEVSEKGESQGQEHVEPCPEGLDWPLQDLEICRGQGCDFYRRKYQKNPERCTWTEWKRIGWEDEVEEEQIEEEEPTKETIAEPEESIESEDDEIVLLLCESGAHKPGLIPHEKRDIGDGWAMYTCLSCKKSTPRIISQAEEDLEAERQ